MASDWFYTHDGQILGPLSSGQLRQAALSGALTPRDHVRRGSDGKWAPATRVKSLFDPPADIPITSTTTSPAAESTALSGQDEINNPKLIACPDCGKSVSRRADNCPHCGCPISITKPQVAVQPLGPSVQVFAVVFRCVVQAVRDVGYAVGKVDKHNGMIAFKTGMSMFSFGQDISLVVVDLGSTCSIDMTSKSGQITDWGESKKIGQKIVARAQTLLVAEGLPNVLG